MYVAQCITIISQTNLSTGRFMHPYYRFRQCIATVILYAVLAFYYLKHSYNWNDNVATNTNIYCRKTYIIACVTRSYRWAAPCWSLPVFKTQLNPLVKSQQKICAKYDMQVNDLILPLRITTTVFDLIIMAWQFQRKPEVVHRIIAKRAMYLMQQIPDQSSDCYRPIHYGKYVNNIWTNMIVKVVKCY